MFNRTNAEITIQLLGKNGDILAINGIADKILPVDSLMIMTQVDFTCIESGRATHVLVIVNNEHGLYVQLAGEYFVSIGESFSLDRVEFELPTELIWGGL